MRQFLLILGWGSIFSVVADSGLFIHAIWLILSDQAGWGLTVDEHLKAHLSWLYWIKDLAYAVLPDRVASFVMGLPSAGYFPVRILLNLLVSLWALRLARRLS